MLVHASIVGFRVRSAVQVAPEDILDAVRTLRPRDVLLVDNPYPGEGPDHFLQWARAELEEAEVAADEPMKTRKSFNAVVQAKCAFECLIDWYLSKYLLDLTVGTHAGLVRKLQALEADERLGVGVTLFTDIIAEPRNEAIHRYELVSPVEARRAYELANLSIRNCRNTDSPSRAPVFFGQLDFLRNREAFAGFWPNRPVPEDQTAFYFRGIGDAGEFAVFFDRNDRDTRVALFESLGTGEVTARFCPISGHFSSEQIRDLLALLEASNPAPVTLEERELDTVLGAMSGRGIHGRDHAW